MRELQENYNQLSKDFRASNFNDKIILEALFDLKDILEERNRVLGEHSILVGIYTLLDFHAKAYALFEKIADVSNRKEVAKLAVLKVKAASHHDTFAQKDPRKNKIFRACIFLEFSDFVRSDTDSVYHLIHKELVVFQKLVVSKKISLRKEENSDLTVRDIARLNQFLIKLGDYKDELIHFYNTAFLEDTGFNATESWYAELEVYRVSLVIGLDGAFSAWITVGDQHFEDHLLDIELGELEIESMNYDG